jgi:hypothetical protein
MPQLKSLLHKYNMFDLPCPAPHRLNDAPGLDPGRPTASRELLAMWGRKGGRKGAQQSAINGLQQMDKEQQLDVFAHLGANCLSDLTPEEKFVHFAILGTKNPESLTEDEWRSYGAVFAARGRAITSTGKTEEEKYVELDRRNQAAQAKEREAAKTPAMAQLMDSRAARRRAHHDNNTESCSVM